MQREGMSRRRRKCRREAEDEDEKVQDVKEKQVK